MPTRGSAAWQRYLKEKHARLVLGAPRSPRLIFHLCEQQPLELRCFGGRTAAMVSARRAPAMARRSATRGAVHSKPLRGPRGMVLRHANGGDGRPFSLFRSSLRVI